MDSSLRTRVPTSAQSVVRWRPKLKKLTNAMLMHFGLRGPERTGVEWMLRDNLGLVKWVGVKAYPCLSSSLEAEALALVWDVNCVSNLGYADFQFESDSKLLIQAVKDPPAWPRLKSYTSELLEQKRTTLMRPLGSSEEKEIIMRIGMQKRLLTMLILYVILQCGYVHWWIMRNSLLVLFFLNEI